MQILSIITKNTQVFETLEFSMLRIYSKTFYALNNQLCELQDGYFKVIDYIDTSKLHKTIITVDQVVFNKPFVKTSISVLRQIEADNPIIQAFSLGAPQVKYHYSNSTVVSAVWSTSEVNSTQSFNDYIDKQLQRRYEVPSEQERLQLRSRLGSQLIHDLLKTPTPQLQYNELTKQCKVTYSKEFSLVLHLSQQEYEELVTKQNLTIVFSEDLYVDSILHYKVIELPRVHLFDLHKNLETLHFPEWVNLKPYIAKLIMKQYPDYELPETDPTNEFFTIHSIKDKFKNNLKLIKRRDI